MAGGLSFLGRSADDASLSPEMQAWLTQQAQAQDVPAAVAPGYTGYNAPTAPAAADADKVLTPLGRDPLPFLGSVARGVVNGATGAAHELYDSGPGFTDRFLKGQIDPQSEEAAGGALGAAGVAMTGSMPFEVPAGALRMFGGRNAATADLAKLGEAERLAGTSADRKSIWDQTGWFQGADDKWRFEIPDNASQVGAAAQKRLSETGESSGTAAGTLWHKDMYDAYPELRRVQTDATLTPSVDGKGVVGGQYRAYGDGDPAQILAKAPDPGNMRSVLLHEMQHGIQQQEGFAGGGIAEPDVYRRLAGEVEARNVQKRRDFSPETRQKFPPWETQDVPDAQQIVRFGQGGPQMSVDPLASLEAALGHLEPAAPPPGPRRLDPNAPSWDVYHGSNAGPDFARFDPSLASNPAERGGVFFAPNPETANSYALTGGAQAGDAGSRVYRATVEPGKTSVFDLAHLAETDPAFNARAREITARDSGSAHGSSFDSYMDGFRSSRASDKDVARQAAEMGYALGPDAATPVSYGYGHIGAALERAKAQGLDTAILRNLAEHGMDDQVVALTPNRVRSYYDPSQILYSGGPAGAVVSLPFLGRDR